ncbi:hypothetical protein FACS189499_00990 [Clostridia bacterium]|nr:hypothetical protein FACS189499_00990 [Clostridia bacterium]
MGSSKTVKVLFLGDVVGESAVSALVKFLPGYKRKNSIDITIINGENSADGNGITPLSAENLLLICDAVTGGNHSFRRQEIFDYYRQCDNVLRPANLGDALPGKGVVTLDFGGYKVAVVSITGNAFMPPADNAFRTAERIVSDKDLLQTSNIIVDFHAEATSEKKAMGYFLDGKVSAVFGTHTHVQTADNEILPGGTAYITDSGMTGVTNSVLGIEKDLIIRKLLDYEPSKHLLAKGEMSMSGVLLELDVTSGKAVSLIRITEKIA